MAKNCVVLCFSVCVLLFMDFVYGNSSHFQRLLFDSLVTQGSIKPDKITHLRAGVGETVGTGTLDVPGNNSHHVLLVQNPHNSVGFTCIGSSNKILIH